MVQMKEAVQILMVLLLKMIDADERTAGENFQRVERNDAQHFDQNSSLEAAATLKAAGDRADAGVVEPTAAHADLIKKELGPITSSPSKKNVSVHKTQTSATKLSETPTEARAQFYAPE